jgi:triosephosphate isomerase (TIM)
MSASKLIVGNWKMNLNPHEASLLVHKLDANVTAHEDVTIVLCPPMVDLFPLSKDIDKKKFKLGAQNVHHLDEGAHTGETSASMLKGLAEYVIVGHSERRRDNGEDDKLIAMKLAAALRHGLKPILCVGETLLDRHHGLSQKVVIDQLTADLAMITAEEMKHLAVAYEPVWAIGTGRNATPEQAQEAHAFIRETLTKLSDATTADRVRIQYGGSVKAENAGALMSQPDIDGALVGGASLDPRSFAQIVQAAAKE